MSKPTTSPEGGSERAATSAPTRGRRTQDSRGDAGRVEQSSEAGQDGYVVRPYRPDDRDQLLELYESVFDRSRSSEWLDWRYGGPYADTPRMFVAERDGELVGAEPFISLAMRSGDETKLALQPADAMVHPDHRRNGLLTRMTERALDYFADREPSFIFNFPNEEAKGAYLKLGWVEVGTVATAYRVQNPSTFFGASDTGIDAVASSAADVGASAFHRVRDAVATGRRNGGSAHDVTRHDGVPAKRLATLYERSKPDRIHTPRTARFLSWRFANPNWDVTTYTTPRDDSGGVDAAIVTATERRPDATTVKVLDAFPLVGQSEYDDEFAALLERALRDAASADTVTVGADTLPSSVLSSFGFYRDDRPPLSLFGSITSVVARPLSPQRPTAWTVGDRHLPERTDWRLPLAEQDTSS